MEIKEIKEIYQLAKANKRARAIKHASIWSERVCVNALESYVESFNSSRNTYFNRTPNFKLMGIQQIDNINSFDHFMQVGERKYLIEVKVKLFDNEYVLKTEQLKRYRRILDNNLDELKDYVFVFVSLFGNYEIGFIRFSDLKNINYKKEQYIVPEHKIDFIDMDFITDEYERELCKNNFLKSIGYKRGF